MGVWAIVVAAGRGDRFGAPKQYAPLKGRRVVDWSLVTARAACEGVVLVVPAKDVRDASLAADVVVAGGATRSASVRAGLAALPDDCDVVAVHDAARPLSTVRLWRNAIAAVLAGADGAVPTVPVTDTIKVVEGVGFRTLDRATLVAVQTPQVFRTDSLRKAHRAKDDATDDAALVEADGGTVVAVPGETSNLKVTAPADLVLAAALLDERVPS